MSEQQQQTPGGGRLFDRILDLGQALSRTVMVGAEPEPPRASPGRERSSSAPQESATGALAPLGDHGAGPPESSSDGRPNSAQRREGTSVATSPPTKEYCVAAGDTLAGVALRFGTTMKVLCRLNGVVGDHALLPGQRLRVPVSEPPPAESGPAAPPAGAGAHRSRNSPSSPPSATDDALRAWDGTGTTVPRVIRADAQFCAAEANVRGMITLTPVMLAFEPSRTDPTSRARGSLHFQFAIDTADIVRCGAVTHLGPDAAPAAPATPQSSPLSDRDDAAAAWGAGSGKRATAEDSASQSPADTRTAFLQVDLPVGAVDRGTAPPAHGASPDAGAPSGERRPPRPLTSARRWSKRLGGSSKGTAGPAPSPPAAASDLGGESAHAEPAAQSSSSSSSSALYDSQRVLTVFFLVAGADVELLVNALCASSERRRRERLRAPVTHRVSLTGGTAALLCPPSLAQLMARAPQHARYPLVRAHQHPSASAASSDAEGAEATARHARATAPASSGAGRGGASLFARSLFAVGSLLQGTAGSHAEEGAENAAAAASSAAPPTAQGGGRQVSSVLAALDAADAEAETLAQRAQGGGVTLAAGDPLALGPPRLCGPSSTVMDALLSARVRAHLPPGLRGFGWRLLFATATHGTSMARLFSRCGAARPCVLAVRGVAAPTRRRHAPGDRDSPHRAKGAISTDGGDSSSSSSSGAKGEGEEGGWVTGEAVTLGAFLTAPLQPSTRFLGSRDDFVFSSAQDSRVWHTTGKNCCYAMLSPDGAIIGAGPAAALALDGSLSCATTEHCDTFGSPPLVPSRAVDVAALEVWAVDVPTTRFEAVETPSQTTATPASTAEGGSSTAQTDPAATTAPLVPSPAGHDAAAEAGEEHAAQSRKPRGRDLNSILAALETADAEEERRAEEVAAAAAQRRRRHSDREAATAEVHVPELVGGQSNILSASHIMELEAHLPVSWQGHRWRQRYSLLRDGVSMETFFARARGAGPTLLAVLTEGGDVLGGFASQSWHHSLQYYGTGESFLFRCTPDVAVFRWTGDNEFFLLGERNRVAMGGGGGFGLILDEDFATGRSERCATFGNPPLATATRFSCVDVELWSFES